MADESTGGTLAEVKVSDEGYIDGITVTLKDGTSKDYLLRPENYDDVEAARKAAEAASGLANAAAANAESATSAATGSASECNEATEEARASKTACDEATKKAALLLPLGLFVDDDGDICQEEN